MRRRLSFGTRAWLGGIAVAGIAAAHGLAFQAAAPEAHHHDELLESTGHRYFSAYVALALGLLVASLAGLIHRRVQSRTEGRSTSVLVGRTFLWLAPVQLVGFIGMETLERLVVSDHGSLGGMLQEPVFWIGIVAQLVVAAAGAGFLALFLRTIDRVLDLVLGDRPSASAEPRGWPRSQITHPHLVPATGGASLRGPPSLR